MSQKYYDGPVKDTERGLEELEKSIEEEKERCKKMNSWEDAKKYRQSEMTWWYFYA